MIMKKAIYLSVIISLFALTSCKDENNKADAYGNFEATEVIVSAQASGQIISFTPEEGILMKLNDPVGLIDTTILYLNKKLLIQQKVTIASQYNNLSSEIKVQEQQLKNTKTSQKRVSNLFKEGAATQKQLDDVNGIVDLIKMQIKAIETKRKNISDQIKGVEIQIEQINESISKCKITNPQKGTILVKYAEQGEVTGIGKPLYKIADLSQMKLKAYISGAQLPNINIGQKVDVSFDKTKEENNTVTGTVSWISETAEFTPKTIQTKQERVNLVYAIKITVQNNGAIKIGMPGEMWINK